MRGEPMLRIPQIFLRDKQAFRKEGGIMKLMGKPLDYAKEQKGSGCKLIHIVDLDAQKGMQNNLDVYNNLTYIINVEVECAPEQGMITRLLNLKCRVVLPPDADIGGMREKKLLVAKVPDGYHGDAGGFHDVILESATEAGVSRFLKLGKRVIIYEKDEGNIKNKKSLFGIISSS